VSGLLAGVGSQLLGTFLNLKSEPRGATEFLLATCYASIFLNIAATICSFVLIDHLGDIGLEASSIRDPEEDRKIGTLSTSQEKLLMKWGASSQWKWMLYHWLITFYLGILTLIISVLTYVTMTAATSTIIVMSFIVASTLMPTTFFIFVRPLVSARKQKSGHPIGEPENTPLQTEQHPLLEGAQASTVLVVPATPS
jgi:hypothetical protein